MSLTLSTGFIALALEGKELTFPNQLPILQILSVKKFPQTNATTKVTVDRFRLVVSDGTSVTHAMLNTQLNTLCVERQIVKNTVIKVKKYIQNTVQSKRILILFDIDVLTPFDEHVARIGNPPYNEEASTNQPQQQQNTNQNQQNNNANVNQQASGNQMQNNSNQMQNNSNQIQNNNNNNHQMNNNNNNNNNNSNNNNQMNNNNNNSNNQMSNNNNNNNNQMSNNDNNSNNNKMSNNNNNQKQQQSTPVQNRPNSAVSNTQVITSIKQLSPYTQKWTILAQVQQKSDIRTWNKEKSQGKLCSVVFCDDSGEIKATIFNEGVDSFYDLLIIGQAYYISQAQIKPAKKEYSTTNNDYEMTLDGKSQISPCVDKKFVADVKYTRVMISDIAGLEKDAIVDVIAVCKESSQLSEITTKANKQLSKRELILVDESAFQIKLTLWGQQAVSFDGEDSPVVLVKNAKVGDFGGRSLGCTQGSTITINPETETTFRVKGWFSNALQNGQSFESFAGGVTGSSGSGGKSDDKNLGQVVEENLGGGEKPDYFSVKASISATRPENLWYAACPSDGCNKKVTEDGDTWRCEKCDRSYDAPQYRYIMNMGISDAYGQIWPQCFNEIAEQIIGKPASELHAIRESNTEEFDAIFADLLFKDGVFKIRAKTEHYNDEARIRYGVIGYSPIDYAAECEILAREIEVMMS